MRTLVDVVAKLDDDGIDIHFLNAKIVLLNMKVGHPAGIFDFSTRIIFSLLKKSGKGSRV